MTSAIVLSDIRVSFGGQRILDGVDFRVQQGEVLGILGRGGSGKSLLLKIIAGLFAPDSGEVYVAGRNILELHGTELRKLRGQMGMLFQNYALFDFLTVEENIGFALKQSGRYSPEEIKTAVSEMLTALALEGTEALYPSELSGGMKKRVGIGRATLHKPEIVLYDDPTAGLDPVTSSKILDLLNKLHREQNSTNVIASHDVPRLRKICDRFLLLHEGRVHYLGTMLDEQARVEDPVMKPFFETHFGPNRPPTSPGTQDR